eukprot:gene12434-16573_t
MHLPPDEIVANVLYQIGALAAIVKPERIVPAIVEFVDIGGLVAVVHGDWGFSFVSRMNVD